MTNAVLRLFTETDGIVSDEGKGNEGFISLARQQHLNADKLKACEVTLSNVDELGERSFGWLNRVARVASAVKDKVTSKGRKNKVVPTVPDNRESSMINVEKAEDAQVETVAQNTPIIERKKAE